MFPMSLTQVNNPARYRSQDDAEDNPHPVGKDEAGRRQMAVGMFDFTVHVFLIQTEWCGPLFTLAPIVHPRWNRQGVARLSVINIPVASGA